MGNVSKRQQPDRRADNSRKPPMCLLCSEKLPHMRQDRQTSNVYPTRVKKDKQAIFIQKCLTPNKGSEGFQNNLGYE